MEPNKNTGSSSAISNVADVVDTNVNKTDTNTEDIDMDKKVVVKYWVDFDTIIFENLVETNTKIFIDSTFCLHMLKKKEDIHYALGLSHTHYLPCVLIDEVQLLHLEYEKTLDNHIEYLKDTMNVLPIMRFTLPCKKDAPPYNYKYVSLEYTNIIKAMIEFVVFLHERGRSLNKFSKDTFYIKDGVLKFAKVLFPEATNDTIKEEYLCILKVIGELIGDDKCPEVLDDLCTKLFNFNRDLQEHA